MDGQKHFVLSLAVGKRGFLVRDPEELRFLIPAAYIGAEGDEGREDRFVSCKEDSLLDGTAVRRRSSMTCGTEVAALY